MSFTKGEIVRAALAEIGLAEYEFDITPEELVSGVRRLDSMLASWSDMGVAVGYPLSNVYDATVLEESSGIPDVAREAVVTNLALRIAPSYGKQVSPDLRVFAKAAMNTMLRYYTRPKQVQFPSMPIGAGYKSTQFNYSSPPADKYVEDVDNSIDISGGPVA